MQPAVVDARRESINRKKEGDFIHSGVAALSKHNTLSFQMPRAAFWGSHNSLLLRRHRPAMTDGWLTK